MERILGKRRTGSLNRAVERVRIKQRCWKFPYEGWLWLEGLLLCDLDLVVETSWTRWTSRTSWTGANNIEDQHGRG